MAPDTAQEIPVTLAAIDPRTALVLIDLQAGTLGAELAHPVAELLEHVAELVAAFRAKELPIVFATVDGTPPGRTEYADGPRDFPAEWSAFAPAAEALRRPADLAVVRRSWSIFTGTGLDEQLKALGVTEVVIAGVATSFGVESTARDAYGLGYTVVVATDAVSDRSAGAHTTTLTRVVPALGQLGTSGEIAALLGA
ncbi:isochorismatase family cysteine hydrolase [Herbiconiux sp. 11R-BC]|uniref:cysteine hydrolase family protein n=1 Tax=Herbiconiux sp. 11R-BC TaxID=3111637 RepID=UPI003C0AE458